MRSFEETSIFSRLTCEQRHALRTDGFLLINAVAGSGKTTQLVALILKALMDDREANLGQFAIITFTRKAGAQLRDRLKKAMEGEKEQASSPEEQKFWERHLTDLPGAAVGTIDALVQDLLRKAAMARIISIDPNLGVLDELGTSELLEKAVARVTDPHLLKSGDPVLRDAVELLQQHRDQRGLLDQVRLFFTQGDGQKAHEAIQYVTQSEANMREVFGHLANPWKDCWNRVGPTIPERLQSIIQALPARSTKKTIGDFRSFAVAWCWDPANPGDCFESLRTTLFTKANAKRSFKKLGSENDNQAVELVESLQNDLKSLARMYDKSNSNSGLAEWTDSTMYRAWGILFREVDRTFEELCREENRFPFSLLARLLDRQLQEMSPEAARSLGLPFRRILVDEFQDNTSNQWKMVCRLAGADHDTASTWNGITVVGDPEQAIYHWRGSNAQLIRLVREQYQSSQPTEEPTWYDRILDGQPLPPGMRKSTPQERIGLCTLSQNWRTHPVTLSAIDQVSRVAMGELELPHTPLVAGTKPGDAENHSGQMLFLHPDATTINPADDNPEAMTTDAAEGGDGDQAGDADDGSDSESQDAFDPQSLKMLACELARLHHGGIPYQDMLILAHSFKPLLDPLQNELDAQNIPYRSLVRSAVWRTQHVRDVVSLARCLGVPDDGLALLAVLRGPCCRLSDSEIFLIDKIGSPHGLMEGMKQIGRDDIDPAVDRQLREHLDDDRVQALRNCCKQLRVGGTWRQPVDRMPHHELVRNILLESGAYWAWIDWLDSCGASAPRRERLFQEMEFVLKRMDELERDRPLTMARMAHLLADHVDGGVGESVETELSEGENLVRLMTIHSSKGLEAKVVAILIPQITPPKRGGGSKGRSYPAMIHLDQQYFAPGTPRDILQAISGLPVFKLDNLDRPESDIENQVSLYSLARLHHQRLQEHETALLFHVAMTRAKTHLIIAGVPEVIPDDLRHWPQKWVEQAQLPDATQRVIPTDTKERPKDDEAKPGDGSTPSPEPYRVKMSFPDHSRISLPATTLQDILLEDGTDKKLELLRLVRQSLRPFLGGISDGGAGEKKRRTESLVSGKMLGTLVHRAFQMGQAFPREETAGRKLLKAMSIGLLGSNRTEQEDTDSDDEMPTQPAHQLAQSAWEIVMPIMAGQFPRMRGLFEAKGQSEVDFALPLDRWVLRGRIDRILDDGTIIDWKTDHGDAKELVESYRPQMTIYALAWWKHHHCEPQSVTVRLALLRSGKVEDLTYTAEELQNWERTVTDLLKKAVEHP